MASCLAQDSGRVPDLAAEDFTAPALDTLVSTARLVSITGILPTALSSITITASARSAAVSSSPARSDLISVSTSVVLASVLVSGTSGSAGLLPLDIGDLQPS